MNLKKFIDWNPAHALVVHHPNGDHFYPHHARAALAAWRQIEHDMGHQAWMTVTTKRARPTAPAKMN